MLIGKYYILSYVGEGKGCSCIAPRREHTSKALRYGTRSQGCRDAHPAFIR